MQTTRTPKTRPTQADKIAAEVAFREALRAAREQGRAA